MKNKTIHVTYNQSGKNWKVKQPSNDRVSAYCDTKAEAIKTAETIARNQGLETKIHNMDGKISAGNSYGNDPFPPKDKR